VIHPIGTAPARLHGVRGFSACLSGASLPRVCRGRAELCSGNIAYPGRVNCRGTEGAAAFGQGPVTATVALARDQHGYAPVVFRKLL